MGEKKNSIFNDHIHMTARLSLTTRVRVSRVRKRRRRRRRRIRVDNKLLKLHFAGVSSICMKLLVSDQCTHKLTAHTNTPEFYAVYRLIVLPILTGSSASARTFVSTTVSFSSGVSFLFGYITTHALI